MTLISKLRTQGGSLVTSLPGEVTRHLAVREGSVLHWQETSPGTYTVSAVDPEKLAFLEAHERAVERYREVFKKLA